MSVFSKIKKWLTKKPKDDKIKEANRVTNYGGGASSKSVQKEVKRSIVKAEAKKSGEKQTERYKPASNSAFKAAPPNVRKAEAKDRQTSKKSDPFNRKNAFKVKHQSTALGTMSTRDTNSRIAKMNAYNENRKYQSRAADKLKPLIDEKYSGDTAESRRRIKSGEYQSDPNVMKYETLKHPIAMSAGRGALSGTTFGLSELAINLLPKSKEVEEAERLYQANKSKGAEFVGEMAGALTGFGLTGDLSKMAVGNVAPKLTARVGESATERLAANQLVINAAKREALKKFGTTATEKEIAQLARARAAKLVAAVGEDMAINLTTGAVSDVSHAIIDSDNPAEFLKNLGISAGMNIGLGALTSVAPAMYRGSALDESMRAMGGDVADFGRDVARNMDNKSGGIKLSSDAKPKSEVIATGKNWISGEDVAFWKDGDSLYVGNPNGEFKSFGKDLPENRIKAEDEFDFINNKRSQQFREARGEKTSKSANKPKAEERPRPEGVRKYSDKQLLKMKKDGSINQLTSDEYKYYIYDRAEDDPFLKEWDSIGADGKKAKSNATKSEEPKAEEPKVEKAKAEEPEETTKKLTKKQLESKKKRSDKRLKAIEDEIKKSPYAPQYEQEKLSAKYTNELEYRKKLDAQIKEAEEGADGTITVNKGKKKAEKTVDESNVTVTKGKEELVEEPPKEKKQKQKKTKSEANTEAKAEVKAETEEPKPSKKVKSLENKIRNSNEKIDNFKKQIAEKKKAGASEKSIANLEAQRKAEMERRKGFKKELKELTGSSEVSKTVEPPEVKSSVETEVKSTGNKKVDSLEKRVAYANDNIDKLKKTLKDKKANGASEKSIAYTEEQLSKEKTRLKELKKDLKSAKKEAEIKAVKADDDVVSAPAEKALKQEANVEPPKAKAEAKVDAKKTKAKTKAEVPASTENTVYSTANEKKDTLSYYKENVKKRMDEVKSEEVSVDGKNYSAVSDSPFDEASTRTTRQKPKFTSKEELKNKAEKKAGEKIKGVKGKAKEQTNKFRRNPVPRGEGLHKKTVKSVTGKELEEAINPPTFKDYIDAKKVYAKGQASNEKEVVSRAGTSLVNATTDDAQREFLREGWRDGNFNYSKIRNREKYADVMKRFVDEPDAVSREIIKYNNDLSELSADKVVDTHYQAHCVMKMLRKEIDNPALSEAERAAAKEVYSSAASLSQKLSSLSGQVNQFQGVMVHCTPAKRADNALDNIVNILDSSRGYRKKTKIEIDGKLVSLSDNTAKRRQQIRTLVLENEDISKSLNKVFDATTEQEYGEAMSELLLSTYKLNHATGFDYLQQWRYLSMLGNPKTHLRNIVGNVTFGGIRNISNAIRSAEENMLEGYAKRHGLDIDYHGGLSAKAHAQARSRGLAKDEASKAAWDAFDKHKNEILGQNKYETPQMHKLFSFLSEANTKLLGAEDDWFRAPAYREQFIKSYNKFKKKGEITSEILSRIHNEALKESQIATFNEFNELAQVLAKSQRGLYDANATVGQKSVALVSNALMPFTKVPANILKQSVNYTPAGALKGLAHIRDAAKSGNSELFNTALDELASGLTGTGIAALGYFFGKNTDVFTTNAGSEDAAAKFKKLQGVQNYSGTINLPNGKTYSVTLDWLVPASCTFFMGVEAANQFKNGLKGANFGEAFGNLSQVMSRVVDPVLETSMLSSIYNIVENARKSSAYDDQKSFFDIASREIIQSYISSYVPTAMGQVARSFIYDSDKMVSGEGDWEYYLNSLKVKMGLADTDIITDRLGADVNAYGEVKNKKVTKGDYAKSFVKNAIIPANIQEVNLTETDKLKIKKYEDWVASGGDPDKMAYLFPKKQYKKDFSYGKADNTTDIKMTNKELSLYNQAKTKGGAEAMRAALETVIFNRWTKDSNGDSVQVKGECYTKEQKEKLIKKFEGKSIREVEEWLYKDPLFKKASPAEQKQLINYLWSYDDRERTVGSKREGERAVIKSRGGDLVDYDYKNEVTKRVQKNLNEAIANGIVTEKEALDFARNAAKWYYRTDWDERGAGSVTSRYNKKEMLEYLESKGISEEKAEALYNAFKAANLKPYGSSSGNGWHRWSRWHGWGGYHRKGRKPSNEMPSGFKAKKANISGGSKVSAPNVSGGINTKGTASRMSASPKINITPLDIKTVRANSGKSRRSSNDLAAALEDIKKTESKVKPPKARR